MITHLRRPTRVGYEFPYVTRVYIYMYTIYILIVGRVCKRTGRMTGFALSPMVSRYARDFALLSREILSAGSSAAKGGDHQVSSVPAAQEGPPLRTLVLQR